MLTPEPGIHEGIKFSDYLQIDAVNNTTLGYFQKTAAHAYWKLTHPEEVTPALRTGDAAHVAILEPARFEREYCRAPKFDKRTNKGKAAAAEWAEKYPDMAALLPAEWDMATAMRDSAWAHPLASNLLEGDGKNEMTVIWKDEETGLTCKARIDRFTGYQGYSMVVDVKTTRDDATPDAWGRTCAKYRYHRQAGFYVDGLDVIAPHPRRFVHLVIEKDPPYCVALMELDDSALDEGRRQYRRALNLYAECKKSGEWPGYPVGIEGMDLPKWAYIEGPPPK